MPKDGGGFLGKGCGGVEKKQGTRRRSRRWTYWVNPTLNWLRPRKRFFPVFSLMIDNKQNPQRQKRRFFGKREKEYILS